ncbi:MAG: GNAT family N-acetyltransferase [Anaerolineae bacterium]
MDLTRYKLVRLTTEMEPAFRMMLDDYKSTMNSIFFTELQAAAADFTGYVRRLDEQAAGINLPKGRVPSDTYWLQNQAGELLGSIHLRMLLTPLLALEAGHIGYEIRPSRRGQGLGTIQLALMLPICREFNLDHVLITCRRDNLASARVIEKNGGVLENEVLSWIHPGTWFKRYWITIFDLPMLAN